MRQRDASDLVDQFIDIALAHQFALLLHQSQLQHLRLDRGVSLRARRLLPLASQVSQVGNAALVEQEAVTLPLDHAFGFEFADVGPGAIKMRAYADALTIAGFLDRGRETGLAKVATVSVISVIPAASP